MKLAGQIALISLTEDGKQVLRSSAIHLTDDDSLIASVEESEDMGLWLRIPREDQMHYVLLRWEYILMIDLPAGESGKLIGIR